VNRIPVPATNELRSDAAELLPLTAQAGREPPRTMAVLARQPDLLGPFLGWAAALALNGVLPKRDPELLALRAASNCGSEFEWTEHAQFALDAGLRDEEIARLGQAIDQGDWSEHERALLRAADELAIDCNISDETWSILQRHYDQPALVEILFVVGHYTMLSMVANAAGLDG
jgi:alkylhydroperoxidase family enzyme